MKCKNCYGTVAEFLANKDEEIAQLKRTIKCIEDTAKDASARAISDQKKITELTDKLKGNAMSDTVTITAKEYEALKADAERYRYLRDKAMDLYNNPAVIVA